MLALVLLSISGIQMYSSHSSPAAVRVATIPEAKLQKVYSCRCKVRAGLNNVNVGMVRAACWTILSSSLDNFVQVQNSSGMCSRHYLT